MERDARLQMLQTAQLLREIGEKEQVDWVSLRQIDLSDWYPVDMAKVFKYYGEFFFKTSRQGVPMGIGTPLRVFQINGGRDNGYKIADGYHRAATQLAVAAVALGSVTEEQLPKMVFEDVFTPVFIRKLFTDIEDLGPEAESLLKVPAIIKKDQTSEDLWNARTSALIGAHAKVMFVRILKMFKDTWPVGKYGDLRQAINQAISAAKNKWRIDAGMNIEGVQAIQKICDDWDREPSTIIDYLNISEKLHPELINKVRVSANRDEDQFGIAQARALANNFPETRYLEWQLVFYDLLEKKRIQREAWLLDAACVLARRLIPYYLSDPMSDEPMELAELASEIVLDRQGPDVRIDTIIRIMGDLQKAPWWTREGKVRYLVVTIVRKAHEEGLNNEEVTELTTKVRDLFMKAQRPIPDSELPKALGKAEKMTTNAKSKTEVKLQESSGSKRKSTSRRMTVVFAREEAHGKSDGAELATGEIVHELIGLNIKTFRFLTEVLSSDLLDDDMYNTFEDEDDYKEWSELMDRLVDMFVDHPIKMTPERISEIDALMTKMEALYDKYLRLKYPSRTR